MLGYGHRESHLQFSCSLTAKRLTTRECISREKAGKQAKGSFPFGDVRHEQEKCTTVLSSNTASQTLDPAVLWADTLLSIKEMLFHSDLVR